MRRRGRLRQGLFSAAAGRGFRSGPQRAPATFGRIKDWAHFEIWCRNHQLLVPPVEYAAEDTFTGGGLIEDC
jgi:hypothetical protein